MGRIRLANAVLEKSSSFGSQLMADVDYDGMEKMIKNVNRKLTKLEKLCSKINKKQEKDRQ